MSPSFLAFGPNDLAAAAPEITLAAAGCLVLLLDAFAPSSRRWLATLSLAAIAASIYFLLNAPGGLTFGGRFETSDLTTAAGIIAAATAALAILVAKPYLQRTGEEKGEFYALLLWGHLGVSLMIRGSTCSSSSLVWKLFRSASTFSPHSFGRCRRPPKPA